VGHDRVVTDTLPAPAASRATATDGVRAVAVLLTAVAQFVVGALGGAGGFGEPIGVVSARFSTPIVPAAGAFAIWGPIYLAVLVLAVRQALPSQWARPEHRSTGWWLVAAAAANAGWIVVFSRGLVGWSEVAILALLGCLAATLAALGPPDGVPAAPADRWTLHGPLGLYAGWVSVATVVGTAATGRWAGLPGDGPTATVLGVVVLLLTGVVAAVVATVGPAPVPYAVGVCWALGGIVVADRGAGVTVAAVVAGVVVIAAVARRVLRSSRPLGAAFG
jgi:translocator protein